MDLGLKGKVIVVTGGAKGIGAAIVCACAAEGAEPVIVDRDAEAAAQLQQELRARGAEVREVTADLTAPAECVRAIAETVRACGRLDGLVNNAGIND